MKQITPELRAECSRVTCAQPMRLFLDRHGLSFLADGVGDMEVGAALFEIGRRVGARISTTDSVVETLPIVAELALLKFKKD